MTAIPNARNAAIHTTPKKGTLVEKMIHAFNARLYDAPFASTVIQGNYNAQKFHHEQ